MNGLALSAVDSLGLTHLQIEASAPRLYILGGVGALKSISDRLR